MKIERLDIPDVLLLTPQRHGDHRGFFSETYNKRVMADAGILLNFVQDNHSQSVAKGTLRGLHFQIPPMAQHKLVRVVCGSVLDVAVDIREGSPTFGRYVSAVISAEAGKQILVPVGFAHGFCTLEPNTELLYKVTDYYSAEHDRGIRWNDTSLAIEWPVGEAEAVLSGKDMELPVLKDLPTYFTYKSGG